MTWRGYQAEVQVNVGDLDTSVGGLWSGSLLKGRGLTTAVVFSCSSCVLCPPAGGEGSLLAAAGSVIGVGSDIGGSIRIPAFFNGIFGHKTTPGKTNRHLNLQLLLTFA